MWRSKNNTDSAFVGPWGGDGARAVDIECTNKSGAGAGQSGPLMISSTRRRGTEAGLSLNHKESRLPVSVDYIDRETYTTRARHRRLGARGSTSWHRKEEARVCAMVCVQRTEVTGV
jgi:hypothetical protein